jgi:hypothetical protein
MADIVAPAFMFTGWATQANTIELHSNARESQ